MRTRDAEGFQIDRLTPPSTTMVWPVM